MSEQSGSVKTEELSCLPTLYYFDVLGGQLLVGQAAYSEHIEAGGNPADCYELAYLLTSQAVDIKGVTEHVARNTNVDWPEEEIRDLGSWLQEVVSAEPYNERLAVMTLERAYQLGLALGGLKKILNSGYFASIGHYLQEIKVEGAIYRGKYASWSFIDCAEYVKSYAEDVESSGRKPRELDFIENAIKGKGPSPDIMQKLTGCTISELFKCVGYVYARNWTDKDFMEWGVRFMMANNGALPSMPNIVALSAIRRGPGMATLTRNYGFDKFRARIAERYVAVVTELRQEFEVLKQDPSYGYLLSTQPESVAGYIRGRQIAARVKVNEVLDVPMTDEEFNTLVHSPEFTELYLRAFPLNDFMNNLKVK